MTRTTSAAVASRRQRLGRAAVGLAIPLLIAGTLAGLAPGAAYPWLKAFHLIAAMAWIGGMVGICYLLAWHAGAGLDSPSGEVLAGIEDRLLQRVVNPAMVLAWGIGLWLGWENGWFASPWLQAKLVLVLGLSGLHGWIVGAVRAFADGGSVRAARLYRLVGLAGGLAAAVTIVLAVVKPM